MEEKGIDFMRCRNCRYFKTNKDGSYSCNESSGSSTKPTPDFSCNLWEEVENNLEECYLNIVDMLKEYCDLKEEYYPLIAVWIIGTYFHKDFESYPFLFLNAMRGSGKTRTLKLITKLAKDGEVQASLTEAVLFRTRGTLGLDEFEGLTRKGSENLRELLNAAYKKGTKVKRMRQKKNQDGNVEQVPEEFNVYRPIVMANIWGMEEVLGDRCITLVLERSNNPNITKLIEIYEHTEIFKKTKELLDRCSLCGVVAPLKVYREWNEFIKNDKTTNYTNTLTTITQLHNTNYTEVFKRLNLDSINGRDLELTMPLIIISKQISEKCFEDVFLAIINYINEKREDQFAESFDVSLIDYVSQETEPGWQRVKDCYKKFLDFTQKEESELDIRWFGRALKRLNLRKEYRRLSGGVQVILNIEKAQEKIKMFK